MQQLKRESAHILIRDMCLFSYISGTSVLYRIDRMYVYMKSKKIGRE